MIETDPLDLLLLDEVEDAVDVLDIVFCQGEAQAGLLSRRVAVPESADGRIEGALLAAELVVDAPDSVQGDADVGDVRGLEMGGLLLRDEGAVGRDRQLQAGPRGRLHEIEEPGVDHRLPARKQKGGHPVAREILHDRLHLLPGQLARVARRVRVRIAMDAA